MAFLLPPITMAHNLNRPMFKTLKAILCPFPISPSRLSFGILTFSKNTCRVLDPLIPSFISSSPSVSPGVSFSTIKQENSSPSTFAKTMNKSANPAFVIHIFWPFKTHSSPSKTALVRAASASEPEFGSVKQ